MYQKFNVPMVSSLLQGDHLRWTRHNARDDVVYEYQSYPRILIDRGRISPWSKLQPDVDELQFAGVRLCQLYPCLHNINAIYTGNTVFDNAINTRTSFPSHLAGEELSRQRMVQIGADILRQAGYHQSSSIMDPALTMWSANQHEIELGELTELAWALSLSDSEPLPSESTVRTLLPGAEQSQARARRGLINFKKTWMYANSRLPPYMPPMVVYMPTWRLLCLAAQASLDVYKSPRGDERKHFISADWHQSTKAMVLKSRPIDDQNVVVFAIRGSQMNFVDWSVNFRPEPTSPAGFLDDAGNACHAGFLTVAKAMIRPVAARLRQLLEENPSRASSSLLITGHSAGGAIAALLYAHMLSQTVESELRYLTGCFKRVHCVTFGTPPLSLLPLSKPNDSMSKKRVFMSFINEGDPIGRAEKAYVLSLARVLTASAPELGTPTGSKGLRKMSSRFLKSNKQSSIAPYWPLPPATLSNAGRIIVLRERPGTSSSLQAVSTTDEQLRDILFGDPAMHPMTLYKERIDQLAVAAVTGSNNG